MGSLGGDQESQAGERRAGERGLHVDLTGLAPELRDRERVRDGLLAGVGLARAARSEAHSGPAARLEDAERPNQNGRTSRRRQPRSTPASIRTASATPPATRAPAPSSSRRRRPEATRFVARAATALICRRGGAPAGPPIPPTPEAPRGSRGGPQ